MATIEDVRSFVAGLPRAYEVLVHDRVKFRVGRIVFLAFSRDETQMGFGFPKAERDGLVASDPATFFLPGTADLRYQWVCARLDRLGDEEMRELVTDAWRMCTPRMLHDLPDLPSPAMRVWDLVERQDWHDVRPLLHPYLRFDDGNVSLRGRRQVMDHLQGRPTPRPPTEVEVRDGQLYRWRR